MRKVLIFVLILACIQSALSVHLLNKRSVGKMIHRKGGLQTHKNSNMKKHVKGNNVHRGFGLFGDDDEVEEEEEAETPEEFLHGDVQYASGDKADISDIVSEGRLIVIVKGAISDFTLWADSRDAKILASNQKLSIIYLQTVSSSAGPFRRAFSRSDVLTIPYSNTHAKNYILQHYEPTYCSGLNFYAMDNKGNDHTSRLDCDRLSHSLNNV